jgi:hypothetical protein
MATAKTVNERKQKQREKLKALDIAVVEVKLSASERAMLDAGCLARGGVRGEYSRDEYIATLIRNDAAKLARDLSQLGGCAKCGDTLPSGCGGLFMGDAGCFHSVDAKKLML